MGEVSDGYHTFDELYEHRITLYIALCRTISYWMKREANEQADEEYIKDSLPWRSKFHYDGSKFDGWYVLGLGREMGKQITYHLPLSRWDETNFAETFDKAPCEFDEHTPADVIARLKTI